MMNKAFTQPLRAGAGFTLLELVVVLIILGVLATLGLTQYGRMVEKSRSAEARDALGLMRKSAVAYYFQNGSFTGIQGNDLGVGTASDQLPGNGQANCRSSHYFNYNWWVGSSVIQIWATRCTGGGKSPQGPEAKGPSIVISEAGLLESSVWRCTDQNGAWTTGCP